MADESFASDASFEADSMEAPVDDSGGEIFG